MYKAKTCQTDSLMLSLLHIFSRGLTDYIDHESQSLLTSTLLFKLFKWNWPTTIKITRANYPKSCTNIRPEAILHLVRLTSGYGNLSDCFLEILWRGWFGIFLG